jgi:serine/threonine protein kinase
MGTITGRRLQKRLLTCFVGPGTVGFNSICAQNRLHRSLDDYTLPAVIAHQAGSGSSSVGHQHDHRDLKPENLLFGADGELKLADFGMAAKFTSKSVKSGQSTPGYRPPEVYRGIKHNPIKADCLALDCIVYMLLTGLHPFDPLCELTEVEIQDKINEEAHDWEHNFEEELKYKISAQAKHFVSKLLKPKQEDRYNLDMARGDERLSSD